MLKMVSVVSIGNKPDDISNFRPESILNWFSKVYENVTKNELVKSINVHVSPFISAYWKNYIT